MAARERVNASATGHNSSVVGSTGTQVAEKWRFNAGPGKALTPVISSGTVYGLKSAPKANLVAIDSESGTELWQTDSERLAHTPPAVRNGDVYIGDAAGPIQVEEKDKTKWQTPQHTENITASVLADEQYILGTGGGTPTLSAFARRSGKVCWEAQLSDTACI